MKFEIAIWGRDEQDLLSGHKRVKAGDIITVKLYPATWGPMALKLCLIVIADGFKTRQDALRLKLPHFADGSEWYPSDDSPWPAIVAKRRFKIPFDAISGYVPELDLAKINDEKYAYQPFKDKAQVEAGCANQVVADGGLSPNAEVSIDASTDAICFDKYKNFLITL